MIPSNGFMQLPRALALKKGENEMKKLHQTIIFLTLSLCLVSSLVNIVPVQSQSVVIPSTGDVAQITGTYGPWDRKDSTVQKWITLANTYGGSYESIGKSSSSSFGGNSNWDIVLFKFGNPSGGKVMLDAYLHGNEFYGHEVLFGLMTWVLSSSDENAVQIRSNNYILVIPCVNYRWGRTNFNIPSWMTFMDYGEDGGVCGVNLNRNFKPSWSRSLNHSDSDSYSGTSQNSEPESQALINAWTKYSPRIYWNLHQGGGSMTLCTAVSTQAINDANKVQNLLPSVLSSLGVNNTGVARFRVGGMYGEGYSVDGAAYRGIAAFLTELRPEWTSSSIMRADLNSGTTFKRCKGMLIAMCQAVEVESTKPTPTPTPSATPTVTPTPMVTLSPM